jgi:hypothetical protein
MGGKNTPRLPAAKHTAMLTVINPCETVIPIHY